MQEVQRSGVQLDICPNCGGVWLDRGELEKIQTAAKERRSEMDRDFQRFEQDVDQFRQDPDEWRRRHPYDAQHKRYRYDDDDDYRYRKKRRGFDLFDIFD
jgi:Zn-finger nucleic acid-binding protein